MLPSLAEMIWWEQPVLKLIRRVLSQVRRWVWLITKGLGIKVTLFEGTLISGSCSFRCLMIGSGVFNEDFRSRVYSADLRVKRQLRVPFFLLRPYVSMQQGNFDLCVAALPSAYRFLMEPVATFEGADLITQLIDTSKGWDGVRQKLSRAKRTQVNGFERKFGMEMRISTTMEDLDFFYRRMFLPYVNTRFGNVAMIDGYSEIQEMFENGGMLLFVLKDGAPVAGALCQQREGRLSYNRAGVLDGNEDLLKCGALTAIYYYQIKYAVENGLSVMNAQQSRPFLRDGVYGNKARWGAYAEAYRGYSTSISYVCTGMSDALAQFFEVCPIIVNSTSGLRAVVGLATTSTPSVKDVRAACKDYHLAGIGDVVVQTPIGRFDFDVTQIQ
jgi:hypothetical protein